MLHHRDGPVFSQVYLRNIGPIIHLHYRFFFDVGKGGGPKALIWLQALPKPHPTNMHGSTIVIIPRYSDAM